MLFGGFCTVLLSFSFNCAPDARKDISRRPHSHYFPLIRFAICLCLWTRPVGTNITSIKVLASSAFVVCNYRIAINMMLLRLYRLENTSAPRIKFLKKYWLDLLIGLTIRWSALDCCALSPLCLPCYAWMAAVSALLYLDCGRTGPERVWWRIKD
mgnify:CR=1 FL=1